MRFRILILLGPMLLLGGCAPAVVAPTATAAPARREALPTLHRAAPGEVGMNPALGATLDSIVSAALADGAASGASLAVVRHGRLVHLRGYGSTQYGAEGRPVDEHTLYDLASLTKVIGTTTAAMMLEENGALDLDRPVAAYLPEFSDSAKAQITVRMLLVHRGGLEAFAPLYREYRGLDQYLEQINRRPLRFAPNTQTVYSDWDLILLQRILERQSGMPLDRLLEERVFGPLHMGDTGFRPAAELRPRIAATEVDSARGLIWGEVHDPNAWAIGGVAGHAGLFSTASDLAIFAQMLLDGGEYGGVRIVQPATLARWTAPQGPGSSRALGWDTPSGNSSAGHYFGPRAFGHTGYTGTSIWIDPERGLAVVLLTNRVHPTSENQRQVPLRRAVADAVQAAVLDAPLVDWEARRASAAR